ncbi:DPOE1 [Hepatospora eriocheir]|uniref:DNA polymerase epsilon catalytic subunit n=1 Tax=Hepatospora eriocheir TaxID=1081669 RepID=A0A1X0QIC1_9MICR|nr:DPOE1 [Hepatospora eriocheir]
MNMVSVLIESMSCLIESLLVSQASVYNVLIKSKEITNYIEFHKDRFVDSKKIVLEEFDTVNPGIFRADFKHKFSNNDKLIDLIIDEVDEILIDYKNYTDYNLVKNLLIDDLRRCKGSYDDFGNIYRLSFDCMYPNIILTNNIQPHAIITGNTHDRCDFNSGNSNCNKK